MFLLSLGFLFYREERQEILQILVPDCKTSVLISLAIKSAN